MFVGLALLEVEVEKGVVDELTVRVVDIIEDCENDEDDDVDPELKSLQSN